MNLYQQDVASIRAISKEFYASDLWKNQLEKDREEYLKKRRQIHAAETVMSDFAPEGWCYCLGNSQTGLEETVNYKRFPEVKVMLNW